MINILRKIFEENPGKFTIDLKDKCSDCGCEVNIEITSTSGGYGLKSGVLVKSNAVGYFAKCPDCYELNPKLKSLR